MLTETDRYDTKTIVYSEDGPGEYTIMITRFNGEGHEALSRAGFRGEYYMYAKVDGYIDYATYKMRDFANAFTAADDQSLLTLLTAIESGGGWDRIEDGETYTPEKIREMFGGF